MTSSPMTPAAPPSERTIVAFHIGPKLVIQWSDGELIIEGNSVEVDR